MKYKKHIIFGLIMALSCYFVIFQTIIPYVFALNDTTKTWTFSVETSSDYTYDSNLVAVDANGAHPIAGVNKITNPAFASDNSSWSTAAVAPSGWVEVPGSGTYLTENFLVMKYEAKCALTSDPTTGLTSPETSTYNTYDDNTTECTSANNRQVVSVASGYPIANIQQTESITRCSTVTLGDTSAHLITNNEWMTIARNIEAQDTNWSGGTVGSGYLFAGHNDNQPAKARIASTTDTGDYRCAYTDSAGTTENPSSCPTYTLNGQSGTAGNQVRVQTLSNSSVLWDIPGNVWEWTDNTINGADKPVGNPSAWVEWQTVTDFGTLSSDLTRPSDSNYYDADYGVGQYYQGSASGGPYAFLRGGRWANNASTGAFALFLSFLPAAQHGDFGLRCASDTVDISHSFSSSSGRSGAGGDTVSVGSVSNGKIYQSVNVGDTSTYDFSVYAYDSTGDGGGVIDENVAQLYYNGSTISTTYSAVSGESGWYKLTGTITGANEEREFGLVVRKGKTVKIDDFTLSKSGTYSVYTTSAYENAQVTTWDSFTETASFSGNASVVYQLCTNEGATCETGSSWQYWDGNSWETASNTTHVNTDDELTQTAMQALSVTSQKLSVKAIMSFGGADTPSITSFAIGLTTDTTPPTTNASSLAMLSSAGGSSVSSNGWTKESSPYFSWTAGADNAGGSGLKGYCLYLGTDEDGNPETSKGLLGTSPVDTTDTTCQFIISSTSIDFATASYKGDTWLSSSTASYYLNIKAIDNADNIYSGNSTQFQFRFDNTDPSNPSGLSAPQEYQREIESITVYWAVSGSVGSSDSHSGVKGYQYRIGSSGTWYGSSHNGSQDCDDVIETASYTLDADYDSLSTGENTFYLRTWDNACNVADSYITAILKYNASSPTAPQNLSVTPSTNTENSFAFSWDAPESYSGQSSGLSYCYSINSVPSATSCTWTSNTSLSADSYATQPGTNTFYVVAKDEAGNVNYEAYDSVNFTANTSAPGVPRNMDIADISIKATSNWKLVLSWDAPSDVGAGVSTYKVYQSTTSDSCSSDFTSFSSIGSTAGTSYTDTDLSQQNYYYCVKACDSANNCSAVSSTVTGYPDGKYTSSASLSSGPSAGSITTKKVTITWSTSRESDSKVQYGVSSGSYYDEEPSKSSQVTSHSITLTSLSPGTTYHYKAKWTDEDGNTGISDEKSFTTDAAPTVKDVSVKNIGISSAIIEFTSTGASKVKIYYGKTTTFGGLKEISTSVSETTYTTQLVGLEDGTKYFYKINTFDSEGDEYEGTILFFNTLPRPRISKVRIQQVKNTAQPTVLVSWTSNTQVSSIVSYYPEGEASSAKDEVNVALVKGNHRMVIRSLIPKTQYILIVKGRDKIGNEAVSDTQRFTTATDTRPPQIMEVRVEGEAVPPVSGAAQESNAQLVVSWNTDEPSTGQVEFGEGTGTTYTQKTQEDSNLTLNHLVIISGLTPSKVYHLRAISKDKAGNEAKSIDTVTITPKATENALNLVITSLQEAFGFLGKLKK